MYEELVTALHKRAVELSEKFSKNAENIDLLLKAADAIEELSVIVRAQKAVLDKYPKWIPVTEHLPKTRESILGKKSDKVIVAFRFNDGTQGTDTAHTLNGEWVFEDHITVVARTITHWMPLPEPYKPKEDEI